MKEHEEYLNKYEFCWSCGKPLESCICGNDCVPYKTHKPSTTLPNCGRVTDALSQFADEVDLRICCSCKGEWVTTVYNWLNGTCPNCGATGIKANDSANQTKNTGLAPNIFNNSKL